MKDFKTKKELDKFIKKETYEVIECLKKIKGIWNKGQKQRYPYGKFIWGKTIEEG